MGRAPQGICCLFLWLTFIQLSLNVGDAMVDVRKLITNDAHPDFVSIDCGEANEYTDPITGISYQTDASFVETGTNYRVAVESRTDVDYNYFGRQLQTLRSFPEGKRNCYTLKPKQGKNNSYLIRAFFSYGNYDFKNQTPTFDLYIGVNFWGSVNPEWSYYFMEIIHTPTTDTIDVCLVKTGNRIPFISALELRPLSNSIYLTSSPSQSLLVLEARVDVGCTNLARHSRYQDDIYDRVWLKDEDHIFEEDWQPLNKSVDKDHRSINDSYKIPAEVLMSGVQSLNRSSVLSFEYDSVWGELEKSFNYYVYLYFAEIVQLPPGQKRVIDITVNDEYILPKPLTLEYLKLLA